MCKQDLDFYQNEDKFCSFTTFKENLIWFLQSQQVILFTESSFLSFTSSRSEWCHDEGGEGQEERRRCREVGDPDEEKVSLFVHSNAKWMLLIFFKFRFCQGIAIFNQSSLICHQQHQNFFFLKYLFESISTWQQLSWIKKLLIIFPPGCNNSKRTRNLIDFISNIKILGLPTIENLNKHFKMFIFYLTASSSLLVSNTRKTRSGITRKL